MVYRKTTMSITELQAIKDRLARTTQGQKVISSWLAGGIGTHCVASVNEERVLFEQPLESAEPDDDLKFALAAYTDVPALIEEVEWRTKHMAETDKELLQLEDWLIGNAEIDPKTGLIDRATKLKERIRDLIAAEAELHDIQTGLPDPERPDTTA